MGENRKIRREDWRCAYFNYSKYLIRFGCVLTDVCCSRGWGICADVNSGFRGLSQTLEYFQQMYHTQLPKDWTNFRDRPPVWRFRRLVLYCNSWRICNFRFDGIVMRAQISLPSIFINGLKLAYPHTKNGLVLVVHFCEETISIY